MSEYFPEQKYSGGRRKVEVDLSNYAAKTDLKNTTGADTSKFDIEVDLVNLKPNVDKLDIDKLSNVKNDVFKKDVYNAKMKNIEDEIPDIPKLATKTTINDKINKVKGEIPNIINLSTTAALTAVESKIRSVTNLFKTQKLLIEIMINKFLLQNLTLSVLGYFCCRGRGLAHTARCLNPDWKMLLT